jgi:hypothetical protein
MIPRPVLAGLLLALSASLPAAAQDVSQDAAPDGVQDSDAAQAVAPGPANCTVRDSAGMITLVICPSGLGAADLQLAGQAACDGREPCLAWIWDDPDVVPAEAPPTSEELGGEALAAARAVWVQDDRQLISMEQPYIGIGAEGLDEDLDEGSGDDLGAGDPLLPPLD